MTRKLRATIAALAAVALVACDAAGPVAETGATAALVAGNDRPFWGICRITLSRRIHDDGSDGGSCGGGHEEEPGGGPPIFRHFDVQGTCTLTHLGLSTVTGRLNLKGPFVPEGQGEAVLGARGRLAFVAADGDTLVGRYVPVQALFTPVGGDGGAVAFTSTQEINLTCEGSGGGQEGEDGGGGGGCSEGEEGCVEPVSTGRFVEASGQATLLGSVRILRSTDSGTGTIKITGGTLTY